MFSAVMFLFVAGYPAGADLWPHGVCAEAGRFCLPQAGGHNTLHHTLPLIATTFLVLSVQLAAIYFILLQLPLVSIAQSAYSMPKIEFLIFKAKNVYVVLTRC